MAVLLDPHTLDWKIGLARSLFLQERFTPGDFDERTVVAFDLCHYVLDRPLASFMKGIGRVTPRAPEIACGQPDEDARLPGVRRFALH